MASIKAPDIIAEITPRNAHAGKTMAILTKKPMAKPPQKPR